MGRRYQHDSQINEGLGGQHHNGIQSNYRFSKVTHSRLESSLNIRGQADQKDNLRSLKELNLNERKLNLYERNPQLTFKVRPVE